MRLRNCNGDSFLLYSVSVFARSFRLLRFAAEFCALGSDVPWLGSAGYQSVDGGGHFRWLFVVWGIPTYFCTEATGACTRQVKVLASSRDLTTMRQSL